MTGGIMYTPVIQTSVNFLIFNLHFLSWSLLHLKYWNFVEVTEVKVFFLVLVYVFNFDWFEFSAAILEKGLIRV